MSPGWIPALTIYIADLRPALSQRKVKAGLYVGAQIEFGCTGTQKFVILLHVKINMFDNLRESLWFAISTKDIEPICIPLVPSIMCYGDKSHLFIHFTV